MNTKRITLTLISIISTLISIFLVFPVHATKYFEYTAELDNDGSVLPNSGSGISFFNSGTLTTNSVVAGTTPQGSKYFRFTAADNQSDAGFEIKDTRYFPVPVPLGSTYYLAYWMRFERINRKNIWAVSYASADKGVEIEGVGIRWTLSHGGAWGSILSVPTGHWTVWVGNPNPSDVGSGHLNNGSPSWEPKVENPSADALYLNQGGYSSSKPIILDYEKWYSVVMRFTFNSSPYSQNNTPDGIVEVWLNGTKIGSYTGIWLASQASGNSIKQIHMGGTIAQDSYNAPTHHRSYDGLLLTDNWQDIIDGGYLSALDPPSGLRIVSP